MTAPRQVLPERVYLLTRRCRDGQFLLRPDDEVRALFDYCLAVAARKYAVALYGWLVMSNHYHLVVRDVRGNFPEFLAWLNRVTSWGLNSKWDRRENLWAAEQPSAVWCVTERDAFSKLIYMLANPVADDLVERVADWPGSSSLEQNLGGTRRIVERPAAFFSRRSTLPRFAELRAERLPGFEQLSDEQYRERIAAAVRREEARGRERRARAGLRVLGRKAILAQAHTALPVKPLPRGGLRPNIACRDKQLRIDELAALAAFRRVYRSARERFCEGDRAAVFPAGTYRMRSLGIACALRRIDGREARGYPAAA